MLYIRDLVSHDPQAEFRNDVQLSHYDDPNINLRLVQSFIFSHNAPPPRLSGVDLLKKLVATFNVTRRDAAANRMVCIANYGHGKSHLALVLANYFSKPVDSPEFQKILEKLKNAGIIGSEIDRLRDFRKDKGEYLVVRLRGDENISLREQCIIQFQKALKEHAATKEMPLAFWADRAMGILDSFTPEQRVKANEFLEQHEIDLPAFRADLSNHREQHYDLTRELIKLTSMNQVLPDLGGEVTLNKLVRDVAVMYCGDGKPLAGILVLFDEFSLFVQRYAQRRTVGELQELLNGIEGLGDKAIFLAFSQHDPDTVAKNFTLSENQLTTLLHELSRLPKQDRIVLYSLIESVIAAYLNQPESAWRSFATDAQVKGPLGRASNVAMDIFFKRYEHELHWGAEEFDKIVTRGAFPLHPLTTAMLCNLNFSGSDAIGNPRTLLGFIRERVTESQNKLAFEDGHINWVLPIYLVDYFKEYLGKDAFLKYDIATSKLPTDAPTEQQRLLKALLLQIVAEIKVNRDSQLNFLEEAAGVSHNTAKKHLDALVSLQCIRWNDAQKVYAFWSSTADPDILKRKIQQKLSSAQLTWETLSKFSEEQVKAVSVQVEWGHPEDWAAKEVLMTRQFFTADRLIQVFPQYRVDANGALQEGVRGGVVWLIPETSDDLTGLKSHVEKVLNDAFPGDTPMPVVVKITSRLYPTLVKSYQTLLFLDNMNEADRQEVGLEMYTFEKQQQKELIKTAMESLRGDSANFHTINHKLDNYVISAVFRPHVRLNQTPSIQLVLSECYRLAYKFCVPTFYKQYHNPNRATGNLYRAVRLLSSSLLSNSINTNLASLRSDKIASDMLSMFLFNSWRVVTGDNRIQEPDNGNISQAWTLLETIFKPGTSNVQARNILVKLLNPPFGYDYDTLVLLFCAWIGFHRHELQFSSISPETKSFRAISIDGLTSILGERTLFIPEICGPRRLSISRRDSGAVERDAQQLIERVNRESFSQSDADEIIAKLEAHSQDTALSQEILDGAKSALLRLKDGLEKACTYDQLAKSIQIELTHGKEIESYIRLRKRISELPRAELVRPLQPSLADLNQDWQEGLHQRVDTECVRLANVSRLQDIGLNQSKLDSIRKLLASDQLKKQADRVETALGDLARREKELLADSERRDKLRQEQEREAPVQMEIKSMLSTAPLQTLIGYVEKLEAIQGLSPTTMGLRDRRMSDLKTQIDQVKQYAQLLLENAVTIDNNRDAQDWQTKYYRGSAQYEDSYLEKELADAHELVKQIQGFLSEFLEIDQHPINNPGELDEKLRLLAALDARTATWTNERLKRKVVEAKSRVERARQEKETQAHEWLLKLQTRYEQNEAPSRLLKDAENSHQYLAEGDRVLLEQVKLKIRDKQDQDILSRIEADFRGISDQLIREQILTRLLGIYKQDRETTGTRQ